jgi:hypothetical protein
MDFISIEVDRPAALGDGARLSTTSSSGANHE